MPVGLNGLPGSVFFAGLLGGCRTGGRLFDEARSAASGEAVRGRLEKRDPPSTVATGESQGARGARLHEDLVGGIERAGNPRARASASAPPVSASERV